MALLNRRAQMPKHLPADKKLVLHVGCGPNDHKNLHVSFRTPEWHELRFDIDAGVKPDIVGTIVDMAGVPDESVDAVWSSHNLEHVYAHEAVQVLGEFYRVLRPGGELLVTMPDMQRVAELIAAGKLEDPFYQGPAGPLTPLDVVFGKCDWIAEGRVFMAHRTGFTSKTLGRKLRNAGFRDVAVERNTGEISLWASARRPD
jgi:ubiquinone/menaquinone biosynthesis C-methylase UbiE